jgi:hypothetical protein
MRVKTKILSRRASILLILIFGSWSVVFISVLYLFFVDGNSWNAAYIFLIAAVVMGISIHLRLRDMKKENTPNS